MAASRLSGRTRGLAAAASDILRFLDRKGVRACVIGGLAVQRWGEPRATQDVALTILAPFGEEAGPLDLLLARYRAREPDAREFALQYRVLKLESPDGVAIDVSLGALPFELEVLDRASSWRLAPGLTLRVCSAEDLIIYKLVAARPRDLLDVDGVVRLRHRGLDTARIRRFVRELGETLDRPDLGGPFEQALRQARRAARR